MWNPSLDLAPPIRSTRLVQDGRTRLTYIGIKDKRKKYIKDTFTTLVEIAWRWNLLMFVGGFVVSWTVFALYYHIVESLRTENVKPCITNVNSFLGSLLFSIETQTTVGYGSRLVTEACPHVFLVVMLQSLVGVVSQAALAGIVIGKVKRGRKTAHTVLFSNSACVYEEDGYFYIAVRVGDIRKSKSVLQPHARGLMIKKRYSKSGCLPVKYHNLKMTGEDGQQYLFISWPTLIVHRIDRESPFWRMTRDDFLNQKFEMIVILEGVVASTSYPFRICVSYLPWDICWGHRFQDLEFIESSSVTTVDHGNFHKVRPVRTPFCSPRELSLMRSYGHKWRERIQHGERRCASNDLLKLHHETDTGLGSFTAVRHPTAN